MTSDELLLKIQSELIDYKASLDKADSLRDLATAAQTAETLSIASGQAQLDALKAEIDSANVAAHEASVKADADAKAAEDLRDAEINFLLSLIQTRGEPSVPDPTPAVTP